MITLGERMIHLWRFLPGPADRPAPDRASMLAVSRGLVRETVGRYRQITTAERSNGRCDRSDASSGIVFSASRSAGATVVALARGMALGIDIERVDPQLNWPPIVRRLFSRAEREALGSTDASERLGAFFKAWTSKEAYLKGIGLGLGAPTRDFSVCCRPSSPPRLLFGLPGRRDEWRLAPILAGTGPKWAGALAHPQCDVTIVTMN